MGSGREAARRLRLAASRLYVVTGARQDRDDLAEFLEAILRAGTDIVQLREKHAEAGDLLRWGMVCRELAARHGALFIVNDRPDVAQALEADGVHLGQNDLPPQVARRILGPDPIIGLSCHSVEDHASAPPEVDYLTAGPVFETPTKPGRPATGLDLVRSAARNVARPWFAVGGIDAETLPTVVGAGATRVAVVRAVTEAPDPAAAVRALLARLPDSGQGEVAAVGRRPLSLGAYVITSSGLVPGRTHRDVALAAIGGGADVVQLRAPELADDELLSLATELASACREAGVLFVVNDRVDVAVSCGADGAHLGQGDDLEGARRALGPDRVLGISVGTPEQARTAERLGADYLGVTVFATATKPEAVPLGLDGLRAIVKSTRLPVVAVGGIEASNAPTVLSAGAAGVAVVSAVGAAPDPVAATRELVAAVTTSASERRGR